MSMVYWAAYSTLGVTNRAYILRADIDLASLVGHRPFAVSVWYLLVEYFQ